MISEEQLKFFLLEAKINTFASGKKAEKFNDGSRVYTFSSPPLEYNDRYFGATIDVGQEMVWFEYVPLWSMVYRGGLDGDISRETCFNFLKECLRMMPPEFPVRGPVRHENGLWLYTNTLDGCFSDFRGEEIIHFNREKVYFRDYCGGFIKN